MRSFELLRKAEVPTETEDLFPEAKRRERRRRLTVLALIVVLGAAGIGYAASSTAPPRRITVRPSATKRQAVPTAIGGPLQHPYGLAVAPNGDLYIVDQGRDQILRRLSSGKFEVVAGNGQRGFSGDGGLAVHSKLSLAYDSGIVVAKSGTVCFSDTGNERVREVLPGGVIRTVAGGGHEALGQTPVPALDAYLGGALSVLGLAIGPNSELYIGAGAVYRLAPNGLLYWVIGKSSPPGKGVYSNPAVQDDFTNPVQLAFNAKGDLFVAGGGGFGLYEDATTGELRFIANVRGDGADVRDG
jgi:glucose/arabinose dehydrogenase